MTDRSESMVVLGRAETEPAWVVSMREHHTATGIYRQEDVVRLLGAPWERVDISLSVDLNASSCVKS